MKCIETADFRRAWGGIASVSMALPVMWTEARRRGFALTDVVRWMAREPARLAGCDTRKGQIAPGYDADFVVFDPEAEFTVTADRLYHRHAISPYLGERLCGVVKKTYVRGHAVFDDGVFPGECLGQEFRP
jgi:allantoinase